MTPPTTRPCLVCGNNNVAALRRVEEVAGEKRIQCVRCSAIYFTRTPEDLPKYDYAYNAHFHRPGDISKAGIMAGRIGKFCQNTPKIKRVLEAGVGNGLTCLFLRAQKIDVEGVEIDGHTAQHLKAIYCLNIHHAKFEKFTPTHDYDLVYSSHVIEHTEDPYAFVRKAYEILRPGGFFWLSTPDAYYWDKRSGRWHHFETRHPFEHLCILSIESIEHLAKKTGFKITDWRRQLDYMSIEVIMQKPDTKKG